MLSSLSSLLGPYQWNDLRYSLPALSSHSVVVTDEASLLDHLSSKQQVQPSTSTALPQLHQDKLPQPKIEEIIQHSLASEPSFPPGLPIGQVAGKSNLMNPSSYALKHAAAPLLKQYATSGCPVDAGPNWTIDQIMAALKRGPHQSAYADGAVAFLRDETKEKVENHYARIVNWKDIKDNLPPNLKISPVAMVPHKSKSFRCILDLTFRMKKSDGAFWDSVNSKTTKLAPQQTMTQLGTSIKRLVCTMANNFDPSTPFIFTKLET